MAAAVYAAADDVPVLKAALAKRELAYTRGVEQQTGGGAVNNRPEIAEAIALAEPTIRGDSQFFWYQVTGWAKNVDLQEAAATALRDPVALYRRKIGALLYPGEAREAAALALFEAARK